MGLKDIGATLPPGFRFYPSDEELVCHYLHKKITNEDVLKGTLVEIDLHTCEPWQLPEVAKLNSNEWYFFSFRDRKYATGYRTNRATTSGYWKATGKDRMVLHPRTRTVVGMRKTLVFYKNRAPNGIKTGWIMHEFRLENPNTPPKEDWVLCRVFQKAKSENGNTSYDAKAGGAASPTMAAVASSPSIDHSQSLPCNYLQFPSFSDINNQTHHQVESTNNFLNISSVLGNDNLHHQLTQDHHQLNEAHTSSNNAIINAKCEDDQFGFLFDMGFQESNLRESAPSTLEDIRFDEDHTSSVFF